MPTEPGTAQRVGEVPSRRADETLDAQAKRIVFRTPSRLTDRAAIEDLRHLLVCGASDHRIGGPKLQYPPGRSMFAREQTRGYLAPGGKGRELAKRVHLRFGARQPVQMMLEHDGTAEERAVVQVEPDAPAPVRDQPMLVFILVDLDRYRDLVLAPWRP